MKQAKMLNIDQNFFSKFITMLALLWSVGALPSTDHPYCPDFPFNLMWNAPTERCADLDRALDLSSFCVVTTTLKAATNQTITMFNTDRFGIFPSVNEKTHEEHNGGVPQQINMTEHLQRAKVDIEFYMPTDIPGLGVLDFEEWRPQWDRNWGSKDIYRQISVKYGQENNVSAKESYESAAIDYFIQSINIGKRLRPKRLWGYYLYPDCYNYDFNKGLETYTGKCPDREKERNDELLWLWKESTALFPSIYLELVLRDTMQARWYVRYRIHESMRVSTLANSSYSIPIYAFIRPLYKDSTDNYMSEFDLVNTIGEAAALGAAGVVSWGDMHVASTKDTCNYARWHLAQVMNPYVANVTKATQLCSKALCQGQGRCVRKQWDSDVFLHLDPKRYQIKQQFPDGTVTVKGSLSQDDIDWFDVHFDCMCYSQEPCRSVLVINNNDIGIDIFNPNFRVKHSFLIIFVIAVFIGVVSLSSCVVCFFCMNCIEQVMWFNFMHRHYWCEI